MCTCHLFSSIRVLYFIWTIDSMMQTSFGYSYSGHAALHRSWLVKSNCQLHFCLVLLHHVLLAKINTVCLNTYDSTLLCKYIFHMLCSNVGFDFGLCVWLIAVCARETERKALGNIHTRHIRWIFLENLSRKPVHVHIKSAHRLL